MYIKDICLENFRNYEYLKIDFSQETNVITGDNAQGKTNLLEAIYYLCQGKSFKTRFDKDIISFDEDMSYLSCNSFFLDRDNKIDITLAKGRKKQIKLNNVKLKSSSELSGKLNVVLFCPEDLNIIKSGAAERRKLIDNAISQLRPKYASFLYEYNKVYENKIRVLKDYKSDHSMMNILDEYSFLMSKYGAEIIRYRSSYIDKLRDETRIIHHDFSGGKDDISLSYSTVKTVDNPKASAEVIFEQLMEHQNSHRRAEIESESCLSGIHKDDIEVEINGKSAKNFASQGQTRTAALSIKLAEREICFKETDECPILLLDDILSELDSFRQNFVLNKINKGQIFITCCEGDNIASKTGGQIYKVSSGNISK